VSNGQFFFPPFRLDPKNAQLWRGEQQINLRRKTLNVLLYFVEHPSQLVTKQALLDAVWPDVSVSDSMPAVCVKELRKALGDEAKIPRFIETVHGRGYRFLAKITSGDASAEAVRKAPAIPKGPKSILVGREDELARIQSWYSQVLDGQRKVVFIAGEAGIGKTAFVRAFLDSITEGDGALLGRGQCIEQYGAGEPYMPLLEALTRLSQEAGGERTVELLNRFAPTWLSQMSALLTPEQSARLQAQTQGVTQQRMLREMAQALEALATELPLVLLLEDLHWSDFSTLELISAVARRGEPARLLILGTYRPVEMLPHDHPLCTMKQELELHRYCEELRLKLLNEEDVRGYLTRRFFTNGSQRFARFAPAIHKRTEGNPLFMVNVVNYLVDTGILANSHDASLAESAQILHADRIEIPRSVRQMIERNLERLKLEEQAVLEGASVAGVEFSATAVAAGLERPQSEVEACCTRLSRREQFVAGKDPIARPDGTVATSFRFLHALYKEVLYERVPIGKRSEVHRRVAETEEAAYGERSTEIAAQLAHHFDRGGNPEKAIEYLSRAGEHAATNGADNEVIAQLDSALELVAKLQDDRPRQLRELRLRISIGPSLMAIKGLGSSETAANYTRALELSRLTEDTKALFEALSGLWTFHLVRAEHSEAESLAQQLLASARESGDDSHCAFAHFAAGNTAFWRGELERAAESVSRSIAACKPGYHFHQVFVDDPTVYSRAYAAWTRHYQGLPDRALAALGDCLQIARAQAHPRTLAMATQFAGHLFVFRREPDSILEHSRTLASLAGEHGFPFYQALAEILAGCAAVQRGQAKPGVEAIRYGLDLWQTLGSALAVPWFLGELAEGLRALGHFDEALTVVGDALQRSERTGERQFAAELYRIAGAALMAQTKVAEAENHFRRAIQVAKTQGARIWELRATANLARLLDRQGKRAAARALLAEIYGWFAEGFDIADLREAKALLDRLGEEPTAFRPSRKSHKNS